jgi:hypothetical protein
MPNVKTTPEMIVFIKDKANAELNNEEFADKFRRCFRVSSNDKAIYVKRLQYTDRVIRKRKLKHEIFYLVGP